MRKACSCCESLASRQDRSITALVKVAPSSDTGSCMKFSYVSSRPFSLLVGARNTWIYSYKPSADRVAIKPRGNVAILLPSGVIYEVLGYVFLIAVSIGLINCRT